MKSPILKRTLRRHRTARISGLLVSALLVGSTGLAETRVRVGVPVVEDLVRTLRIPGTALPLQQAMLAGRVEGYLEQVLVTEGDRVTAKDTLARISVPDLRAQLRKARADGATAVAKVSKAAAALDIAKAAVSEAEATVVVARADLVMREEIASRRRKLLERRAVTTEEADEAESRLAVARAQSAAAAASVESARARIKDAEAAEKIAEAAVEAQSAEIARIEALVGFAEIRSPFDSAVVTRRHLDPGALIQDDGAPILTVMDVSRIRVLVRVPERDALSVRAGLEARVRFDAGGGVTATVTRVSGAVDGSSGTMRTEIEIPNDAGTILPGMFCDVSIVLERRAGAIFLPSSAIYASGEAHHVFVFDQGVARRVPVTLGADDGRRVEVRAGLAADAQVILGRPKLEDGESVEVSGA